MYRLLSVILILVFLACNKQSKEEEIITCVVLDKVTLPLHNCSEKTNSTTSPFVCFEEIEDSRCPANVVCVWEGVAIAKFSFTENSTQHQFKLSTKTSPGFPPNDTLIAGYKIKLLDILPYPGTGTQPVHAVLQITR